MSKGKIAIVTDSTCDLDNEFLKKHNVHVLPLKIIYPNEEYLDRVEIQPEEMYKRFPAEIPKTSMPGIGEVIELFERLRQEGIDEVISIHISSGLSGTFEMVRTAAAQFEDMDIKVVDSKALSLGMGFLVVKAVELKEAGEKFSDIVNKIELIQQEVKVFFVVKTLEYLRKGGRIGLIEGALGDLLNVKPIVSINEDGKYYTYAKVRGRRRSLNELVEIVKGYVKDKEVDIAVMHGGAEEECQAVKEKVSASGLKIRQFISGQIGPSMVVHTGPGLVGIAFKPAD